MKSLLTVMTCLVLLTGCSRVIVIPEQDRVFRKVYEVKLPADEIYTRSLDWIASNLTAKADSIEVRDKDRRKIIGRGSGKYSEYFNFLVDRQFGYTVTVEARENRYRLTVDNFVVYYEERDVKATPARYKFEISKIRKKVEKVADDLFKHVSRAAEKDWDSEKGRKADEEKW